MKFLGREPSDSGRKLITRPFTPSSDLEALSSSLTGSCHRNATSNLTWLPVLPVWGTDLLRATPDADANELDGGEVVFGIFAIAGGDAPELLDPVEEALDEIALAVKPR